MSNGWIPIDKASINYQTRYEVTYNGGKVEVVEGHDIYRDQCTAIRLYEPTPYVAPTPINPGDGWRLLGENEPKQKGDQYTGTWEVRWQDIDNDDTRKPNLLYRRRIEPTYRPFANAAEYKPHRERWLVSKHGNDWLRLKSFSDESDWDALYELWLFEDTGTPFGVEVTK